MSINILDASFSLETKQPWSALQVGHWSVAQVQFLQVIVCALCVVEVFSKASVWANPPPSPVLHCSMLPCCSLRVNNYESHVSTWSFRLELFSNAWTVIVEIHFIAECMGSTLWMHLNTLGLLFLFEPASIIIHVWPSFQQVIPITVWESTRRLLAVAV